MKTVVVHVEPADPYLFPHLTFLKMGTQTSKPAVVARTTKAAPIQALSEKPLIEPPPVEPPEDEDPNETYASVTISSIDEWHSSLEAVGSSIMYISLTNRIPR